MIKNSTYIRSFTAKQRKQLEQLQEEHKLKTVPDILFFALEKAIELKQDNDMLHRIIALKQKKIESLTENT